MIPSMYPHGPIAILCAMTEERDAVVAGGFIPQDTLTVGRYRFEAGQLDGHAVVVVTTGIGKINASAATAILMVQFQPRLLFFSGVAGAVDDSLDIGDIVLGTSVTCHDYGHDGEHEFTPYKPGALPLGGSEPWSSPISPKLLDAALTALHDFTPVDFMGNPRKIVPGRISTGDTFVANSRTRANISQVHQATVLEMETVAVALLAKRFGVPFLPLRAVSDKASGDAPEDFPAFLKTAADTAVQVLRRLLPVV